MVLRIFFALILSISVNTATAQTLDAFNEERLDLTKKGMIVLGSWAGANIALSPILASSTTGSEKYFHHMNGYWNGFNLALAGIGLFTSIKGDPKGLTMSQTLKEQQKIEKTLLFNAGLDLAYVAGGFYLQERAKNSTGNTDRLKGYGQSLVLQGGFLFAFDLAFYAIQKRHGNKLFTLVDGLAVHPSGFRIMWKI